MMRFLTDDELACAMRLWGEPTGEDEWSFNEVLLSQEDLQKAREAFYPLTEEELARVCKLLGFPT